MLTAVDITDIENIKEVLKNSENKYHQLFDQMLNGFASHEIICNSEGKPVDYRFIEINNSFSTMTGLNSDIIGKTCLEILPDIEPFWIDNYGDVALKGKTICFEQFNVSLNKYFEVTAYSTQKGQFITLFNDITERKIFEKDLLKTNIFLDSIIENIPNMVFLKEAQELRFVRINKAGEDLLGVSEKEMLGKNDYDFFPKEQADFFIKKDRQVLNGKDILDIPEEPIHTKYQGIRILHTQKVPLFDARGNPEYLLGISVDITERKEAEKKLKEKMDELQRFHRLTIGREMFMIELKKEVNELLKSVGREEKYKIVG